MPYDLLIRHGQVVLGDTVSPQTIAIAEGKIVDIAPDISGTAKQTIDAKGLHIFPGMIDPHVHFNDAGPTSTNRLHWEGAATGSAALAAGGGTMFIDMPLNASPPTLDAPSFDLKLAALQKSSRTDFALWGGLTPANLDHMEVLAHRGVMGFKAFMSNSGIDDFLRADDLTLYRGMQIAKKLNLPVAVHAESEEITSRLSAEARAGNRTAIQDYLASRPIIAEVEATARAILFAEETGCKLHIVHVSNSRSAELVRRAAAAGHADVTCETCPHYLTLSCHDLERLGAAAKCAPPLRTPADIDELWNDLAAGKFSFVASDHSPSPPDMKTDPDFFKIWGGIAGVQSTLPILLSHGPALPLPQIAALTSTHIAARFNFPTKGKLAPGFDADLTLIDINACYELTRDQLHDRHKLSPYTNRTFHGKITRTLLRGQTIFENGELLPGPAPHFLRPASI